MSNGSPGYFEDWNEFLTYLNGIANTTVFDKFRAGNPDNASYHYNSEMSVDPNPTIKVTPAIENIAAQLVHIVSSDPTFSTSMPGPQTPGGASAVEDMMEHGGWYLETTIFDPDNADMDSEEPYIFLTCTQVGRGEQYLYGLLLSFIGTPKDPILNAFQLIAQRYHLPQDSNTGWKEDTVGDESKDWSVPNWAYIYSETPFISPRTMGVINFPYGAWGV